MEEKKKKSHFVGFLIIVILASTFGYGYYYVRETEKEVAEFNRTGRRAPKGNTDPLIGISYDQLVQKRGKPDTSSVSNEGDGQINKWCWMNYKPHCFYDKDNDKFMDAYDSDIDLF